MTTALTGCARTSESLAEFLQTANARETQRETDAPSSALRTGAAMPRRGSGDYKRSETIAIHGGYEVEPTTKAVAVPIYQTVAYAFDSAVHGAALFNLEVEGFRYSRISN